MSNYKNEKLKFIIVCIIAMFVVAYYSLTIFNLKETLCYFLVSLLLSFPLILLLVKFKNKITNYAPISIAVVLAYLLTTLLFKYSKIYFIILIFAVSICVLVLLITNDGIILRKGDDGKNDV